MAFALSIIVALAIAPLALALRRALAIDAAARLTLPLAVAAPVAALAIAQRIQAFDAPLFTPEPSLWPLAGLPVLAAYAAAGAILVARPTAAQTHEPQPFPIEAPLAAAVLAAIAFIARLALLDTLLLLVALPAWIWLIQEQTRSPGPAGPRALALLAALVLAIATLAIGLLSPAAAIPAVAIFLLALLLPVARLAATRPQTSEPILRALTLAPPLAGLIAVTAASTTDIALAILDATAKARAIGSPRLEAAAEVLAAQPRLVALEPLLAPALLALALPLILVAAGAVSPRTRRLLGAALVLVAIAAAISHLALSQAARPA